jgi:hypothetical protein
MGLYRSLNPKREKAAGSGSGRRKKGVDGLLHQIRLIFVHSVADPLRKKDTSAVSIAHEISSSVVSPPTTASAWRKRTGQLITGNKTSAS